MTTSIETSLEKSAETSTDANLAQGAIESVQERVSTRVLFKWPGALKKRFGLPERFSFPGSNSVFAHAANTLCGASLLAALYALNVYVML
jgi:hypothetical protein